VAVTIEFSHFVQFLQLWSSDSGGDHWSSCDEGVSSCASSSVEVPSAGSSMATVPSAIGESKSPEKRKLCDSLLYSPQHHNPSHASSLLEKRKSYAEGSCSDSFGNESSRPKRWSLAENVDASKKGYSGESSSEEGPSIHISQH